IVVFMSVVFALLAAASTASAQIVPIAPPKPAVARNPNAILISTGDLNEAVNWARQGQLDNAITAFNLFKDDWNVVSNDVRGQSDEIADRVDAPIVRLDDLVHDSPPPAQSTYFR